MDNDLNLFVDEFPRYDKDELNKMVDGKYSVKVKTPIYQPRNVNTSVFECFNHQKYLRLLRSIEKSSVTDDEKTFLRLAASRFIEINYEKAADYYAIASKECQEIMENLALVIIDFDKAIEGGFIQLNDKMRTIYEQEID